MTFPIPIRKLRSDSVLDRLTKEQKIRLWQWLDEENRPYAAVRALVAAEFGVTTSGPALCRYFRRQQAMRSLRRQLW